MPVSIGSTGGPGGGKSHFAATLFKSEYFPPEKVLYFDNHGSTDTFDLPQWSTREPWGVRHTDPEKPQELHARLVELRTNLFFKHKYPYAAIVIDDWSTHAQDDIDDQLDGAEQREVPKLWGKHGEMLRADGRIINPDMSHAHHIGIFQAGQFPDPLDRRPQNFNQVGQPVYTQDTRDTKLRPFLQGQFGSWFPFKLDAVFYQYMEVKAGRFKFHMQLTETPEVWVKNRWLDHWVEDLKLPKSLEDPTFDKLYSILQGFTKETDGN